MQQAQLRNTKTGDVLCEVLLPKTMYEVPLNRYIDFITEYGKEDDPVKRAGCITNAVCAFYDIPLKDALQSLYGQHTEQEIKDVEHATVSNLYGYALKLVDTHLNENYKRRFGGLSIAQINFDNQDFETPILAIQTLARGIEKMPDLSVNEMVEAMEVNRMCEQLIFDEGDPDGSHLFARYLKLLAVFVRKDGEILPFDDKQREDFIQQRAAFFGGLNDSNTVISAGLSLDIDFFLTSFSGRLAIAPVLLSFLTLRSLALVAETKKQLLPTRNRLATLKSMEKKSLNGSGGAALSARSLKRAISRAAKKRP